MKVDFFENSPFPVWWISINVIVFGLIGLLAESLTLTLVLIAFFLISIVFSISTLGEKITRYFLRMKPIKTEKDKAILLPAYNAVYESVKEKYPLIADDIELYIEENGNINACALGRRTICITTGALNALNEDEILGILCHEFGHHINSDTFVLLFLNCGGGILSLLLLCISIINALLNGIIRAMYNKYGNESKLIIYGLRFIKWLANLITKPIEWILMAYSRRQEYKADSVAYDCGYGNELIEGLYTISNFSSHEPIGLMEKLKSSHPDLKDRISKLENQL